MPVTVVNPAGLPGTDFNSLVAVATSSRLVFIAGQVDWSTRGTAAAADLDARVERCFLHAATALAAAGAALHDVARMSRRCTAPLTQ